MKSTAADSMLPISLMHAFIATWPTWSAQNQQALHGAATLAKIDQDSSRVHIVYDVRNWQTNVEMPRIVYSITMRGSVVSLLRR